MPRLPPGPSLADTGPVAAHAGEARRRILPTASTRGAFGGDGERHRAARRRIAVGLRPDALLLHDESMARFAEKHADAWPRGGEAFRLLDRMRQLVDDVFVRLVLGVRDEQRARAAVGALRRALRHDGRRAAPGRAARRTDPLRSRRVLDRPLALLRRIRLAPVASDPEPMVLRGTVLVPRDGLLVRRIS